MIPQKLHLYNFMSYADSVPELDFRPLDIACLAGSNGAGKSALLEGIGWALWGKSRAKSDDDLIHQGKDEMVVSFEFELEDNQYRVVRKRSRKRKGQGQLEFFIFQNGDWQSLSGTSKAETQEKINQTLRMNYETFINSSFLRQGHADEFTTKRPQERKAILSNILGLDQYNKLQEEAKEEIKIREIEKESLGKLIESFQEEVKDKDKLKKILDQQKKNLDKIMEEVSKKEKEVENLQREKAVLEKKESQLKEITAKILETEEEISDLEREILEHKKVLTAAHKLTSQKEKILENYKLLQDNRKLNEEFSNKLTQQNNLLQKKTELEDKISAKQKELDLEKAKLAAKIQEGEKRIAEREGIKRDLEKVKKDLEEIRKKEKEREKLVLEQQKAKEKLVEQKIYLSQIENEGKDLREKILLLSKAKANCPLCKQNLTEEHRQKIKTDLSKKREEKVKDYKKCRESIAFLKKEISTLDQQIRDLEAKLQVKSDLEKKLAYLENQLLEAEKSSQEVKELKEKRKTLDLKFRVDPQALSALEKIKKDLEALKYDASEHRKIQKKLQELAKYEELKRKLDIAEEKIKSEETFLQKTRETVQRKKEALKASKAKKETLILDPKKLEEIKIEFDKENKLLERLRQKMLRIKEEYGVAKERVFRIDSKEKEIKIKKKRLKSINEEISIYNEIAQALGKKGVQAMIIESVIPEIEEEANKLLSKMSSRPMEVQFLMQKEKKTDQEIQETLDIQINDSKGTRPYEMFSGGEAFRINFAIRVALSKLLTRRAGAKFQLLVIDEGFGGQDAAGREYLIEAINSIKDDFQKILIVSHIQELRDVFSTRIEVTKDENGSHFEVVS